jgi:putative tricarboxylic transport membrane protein
MVVRTPSARSKVNLKYKGKGGIAMEMGEGKKWSQFSFVCLIIVFLITGLSTQVRSQENYPTKAIDFIVPVVPGAGADFCARLVAEILKKRWDVPLNVLNKPGGNSIPANLEVYQARPDGYTVFADSQSSCSLLEVSAKDLPFKVLDRSFIALMTASPHVFYVPATSPIKNLKDLAADAKGDPEHFTWASFGGAGAGDFLMRQFFKAIGVDVLKTKPIVVRGSAEALSLVAGGHVKVAPGSPIPGLPHVEAGTVRAVGVTGERVSQFPEVPTTVEQGYIAVSARYWWGISGPPNLPAHIIAKWNEALQEMLKNSEFITKLKNVGFGPFYLNSLDAREYVRKEMGEARELWSVK